MQIVHASGDVRASVASDLLPHRGLARAACSSQGGCNRQDSKCQYAHLFAASADHSSLVSPGFWVLGSGFWALQGKS